MPRKAYPLRVNPEILSAVQRWADDDLRSVNAQIEFLLRDALIRAGRIKLKQASAADNTAQQATDGSGKGSGRGPG